MGFERHCISSSLFAKFPARNDDQDRSVLIGVADDKPTATSEERRREEESGGDNNLISFHSFPIQAVTDSVENPIVRRLIEAPSKYTRVPSLNVYCTQFNDERLAYSVELCPLSWNV